jgi:hypothetical protein
MGSMTQPPARREKQAGLWLWLLAIAGLALVLTFLLEPVDLPAGLHGPDGRNYLSQLDSLLFDRDLLLYNNNALLEQTILVTPTGYALELHNVGTALAFLPFHALGYLTCRATGGSCTGQDLATGVWLSLGNWVYGLLALVITWRLVSRHTARRWATLSVAAVALGSPFFYYWSRFFNPHMPALFLIALFTLVWDRTRDERPLHAWLLLGLLAGAAACIASYHIVILLLPASDLAWALLHRRSPSAIGHLPSAIRHLLSAIRHLLSALALAAGALAGFAPQLVTWKLMFGSFLGTPYSRQLFWLQPGLPDLLFSSYHGLYFYAPLLLIATIGFVPLFRRDRRTALSLLLAFAATVYAASCNIAWWGGASFGARYLLGTLPWLALALAVLLAKVRWRALLYVAMAACIAWTYGLFLADFNRLVDPGQYIPAAWQVSVQATVLSDLPALLRRHLLSPRFELSPVVAVPGALLLAGLARLEGRIRRLPGPGLALTLVALPVLMAALLAASGGASRREIARLEREGALAAYPRAGYDRFDLSEGFWQRGAYRFVRGDLVAAHADWDTAQQLDPSRSWVRLHRAGLEQIPHELYLQAGDRLMLAGWEAEPGSLALYWFAQSAVLSPTYRTALSLADTAGQEVALYTPQQPDTWRALALDLVRVSYPLPAATEIASSTLTVTLYPASGDQLLDTLEVALDEP